MGGIAKNRRAKREIKISRVGHKRPSELTPDPKNPHEMDAIERARLSASIDRWGVVEFPIWNERTGETVGGHKRVEDLLEAGYDEPIPVVIVNMSRTEQRALNITLNSPHVRGHFTSDVAELLKGLKAPLGAAFGQVGLDALLKEVTVTGHKRQLMRDADEIPDLPKKAVTKRGEIWELGEHRLICGDCTDDAAIDKLRGDVEFDYTFTSPPYGIDLSYERGSSLEQLIELIAGAIRAVNRASAKAAYATMNYADVYPPGGDGFISMSEHYSKPFADLGWALRGNRIWLKPFARLALSYASSTTMNLREWEYVQTWRRGRGKEVLREHGITARGVWKTFGDNAIIEDWKEHDSTTSKSVHPAAFPVVLPIVGIRCYTDPAGAVFEPFAGSGTTIIACEITGRRGFGVELDPAYCDLIVERWQNVAGGKAKRVRR